MLVFKGRYDDMRERALRAESQVDELLDMLESMVHEPNTIETTNFSPPEKDEDDEEDEAPNLPPPIEEAITRRARPGSTLDDHLRREAAKAMSLGGRDFDADTYAQHIERGSRLDGWPL